MDFADLTEQALDVLDAEQLREAIRELLPWMENRQREGFAADLVDRATRTSTDWAPPRPNASQVRALIEAASIAKRLGEAEPEDADTALRWAEFAFLNRDYAAASMIFRAWLLPVEEFEIDVGGHESADEVLGVDLTRCATYSLVCAYMLCAQRGRAAEVYAALQQLEPCAYISQPIARLERGAMEPLPDFETFLDDWRRLLLDRRPAESEGHDGWREQHWLVEAVLRTEGIDGLATLARRSGRVEDLRVWCRAVLDTGDLESALAAYDEAAAAKPEVVGFRDEGARLALRLGRADLAERSERAWFLAPSLERLQHWLGCATNKDELLERVSRALEVVPERAARQRALLHCLRGEFAAASRLLARAPGLGWSGAEHPGHLVFSVLARSLGGLRIPAGHDYDAKFSTPDDASANSSLPTVESILRLAEVKATPCEEGDRRTALASMREAVEKRMAGVVEKKRRRYYGHAAMLACVCLRLDPSEEGSAWFEGLRREYRRFHGLQRELRRFEGVGE